MQRLPSKCSFLHSLQSNYSSILTAGGESFESFELKVLLSVVSELSLLMEYLRRFSSICNKRNWTLHFESRKLISAPKHCYLNICTSSDPTTSQSLPLGQTTTQRLKKTRRKQLYWILNKNFNCLSTSFPTSSSYTGCMWITQLCMEICLCKICIQMSLPLQQHCQGRKLQQGPEDALADVLWTTCASCKVKKCGDRRMETAHSRYVCRGK